MRGLPIFIYIFLMWILMIIGGGILVVTVAPISISGYGDLDMILTSGLKAIIAIILVIIWILVLSKLKKAVFHKTPKLDIGLLFIQANWNPIGRQLIRARLANSWKKYGCVKL